MSRTVAAKDANDVSSLLAVSSVDGETPVVLWADPVTHRLLVQGVNPGFQQPLTGTLNQTTFTWTTAPNVIVVDGIPMRKTQLDGTVNWIGTTTTVLQTKFPTQDIFATA